ncbi:hypothetical protein [Burkholderia diffusa]|uniref:hypothetical protein n=1 Tax=Burkholderia diffusa TaxID=488732 RepID=UPI002ABDFDF7|nr:hypothetical protein [Burkholderia diffusa]
MDAQIDYAVGMPIGLLDELPRPVDVTEALVMQTGQSLSSIATPLSCNEDNQ